MAAMVEAACQQCGEPFTTRATEVRRGAAKYCSPACHYATIRTRVERPCETCGQTFSARPETAAVKAERFCSKPCQYAAQRTGVDRGKAQAARAARRARAISFVAEVNARTVCAHCGAQPIEWHNPEHVELNRQHFRISAMVAGARSPRAIQAEMDRCTPLCRRCHMLEDGRMKDLVDRVASRPQEPAKPCAECRRPYKPLRRGLCGACYQRQQKEGACLQAETRRLETAEKMASVAAGQER